MDELAGGEEDGPAPEAGSERAGLTQTICWCLGFKVQEKEQCFQPWHLQQVRRLCPSTERASWTGCSLDP